MKKVQVVWTDESFSDLESIYDFLAEKSPGSAKKAVENILSRTRQLENFPESGSLQPVTSVLDREHRYLIEGHYKVVYHMSKTTLYVDTVVDTRQNPVNFKL